MSDSVSTFFDAWEIQEPELRGQKIEKSVSKNIEYNDPRTPDTIEGVAALSNYVGMFSNNAPGWSAKVIKSDTVVNHTRVTVAFSGNGPDGSSQVQLGQYFVEMDGALISKMVGFVGTGEAN